MIFQFASFTIDEKNCTLTQDDQNIEIEPKVFSLLCFFCHNSKRAVSRDELIEKVWDERIVSNAAINRAVGELRKVIEVDVKNPQYIATISKVGYRFNADIVFQDDNNTIEPKVTNNTNQSALKKTKLSYYFATITLALIALFIYINNNNQAHKDLQINVLQPVPLTTVKGNAFKQQVFDDGQAIFLHRDTEQKNVQLWLQKANVPALQLTQDSFYYTYAIFKDADTVIASRFDNLTDRNCQIVQLSIATKKEEEISTCAKRAVTYLAFDNRAQKLYFNYRANVSQPFAIRSLQLDTGRIQQLTHANPEGNTRGDYLFSLSPNGEKMAIFEYIQDGTAMLKIAEIDNPTNVKRYQSYDRVSAISWFNNNALLISEQKGIISYDLLTSSSNYIVKADNISQASFVPALSLLSYVKFDHTRNIYQLNNANEQHAEPLTHSAYINFSPSYANTTNALAYISTDSGNLDIQLIDKSGNISSLKFPDVIKHFSNLTWSDDDNTIFASINSKLFQYSMQSGQWQPITSEIANIHYVEAINNEKLIVSSDQSGDWQLWQIDIPSQTATQLTKNGGYSANYNAQTNTLLLSKFSQEGLFKFDLQNQTEIKITDDFKITDWNKWQVRGENIYLWESNAIVERNIGTNKKLLRWKLSELNPSHFSINFDATKVAYSVTEQEKSTIWKSTVLSGSD